MSRKQLPDLTSQEQMHLIALSDTVASTNLDLERGDSRNTMKYSKEDNPDIGEWLLYEHEY